MTFKIKIKHPKRGNLKISAGISSDINSSKPEIVMDFPVFNFQGGPFCMTGVDSLAEPDVLEFGIDITDLKKYIPENGLYEVFLNIENHGVPGELQYFSIIDYSKPAPEEHQIVSSTEMFFTGDNYYFQLLNLESRNFFDYPKVINETSILGEINNKTELNIFIEGGQTPYEYSIEYIKTYSIQTSLKAYPSDQNVDYDTITSIKIFPDWKVPLANELWDSLSINTYGIVGFYNKEIAVPERRYPYELYPEANRPTLFSSYARYQFYGSYPKPASIQISDTEIEIFLKYRKIINSIKYYYPELHIQLTKLGVIEVTYSDSIPQSDICAQIRSDIGNYFVPYSESEVFNTVTFTPIIPDSLFTIDSTGLLAMRAVSEPGVYEVYVKVKDANGDEFTKRFEFNIIDENLIGDLYPNPSSDFINFNLQTGIEQSGIIEIFDISGRLLYKETTNLNAGINTINLNINDFCHGDGCYFLRASFDNKSQVKRFIFMR
ncbi:MAG: T9SS type A sorting domain-containing protein [Bacteroidales bacterium]|nr:T9SS type A sorting domain-containing protein [Bacteroidales bacterium]